VPLCFLFASPTLGPHGEKTRISDAQAQLQAIQINIPK
jgi:hypothetical protein